MISAEEIINRAAYRRVSRCGTYAVSSGVTVNGQRWVVKSQSEAGIQEGHDMAQALQGKDVRLRATIPFVVLQEIRQRFGWTTPYAVTEEQHAQQMRHMREHYPHLLGDEYRWRRRK